MRCRFRNAASVRCRYTEGHEGVHSYVAEQFAGGRTDITHEQAEGLRAWLQQYREAVIVWVK